LGIKSCLKWYFRDVEEQGIVQATEINLLHDRAAAGFAA
jgi:hypothetical protein